MSIQTKNLSRVAFAQKSKLTVLLHQLVRSYPKGVGVIHEFIQNADDAGATTLSVILDERQHPIERLPSEAMSRLQGPALLVVNDASFTEDDWERIQSTGRSGKVRDASKTGRFGLGFNSVYNVTDWPGVLTHDRIGYFDPHGDTVHEATRDEPGAAWLLTEELWDTCSDLLVPFREYGLLERARSVSHTVFRLPIRDEAAAKASEICNQPFTRENFDSLVNRLIAEAGELLLFLKNLSTIHLRRIASNSTIVDLVTIRTVNEDEVAMGRRRVHGRLNADYRTVLCLLRESDPEEFISEYEHRVVVECPDGVPIEQTWSVVQALAAGPEDELLDASAKMYDYEEKAVPLVGAAALVSTTQDRGCVGGRLFCTLPLSSVLSSLPFHINGFFDLQSDRQGLFADEGAEGKGAVRVQWNRSLLEHGCARVAARLLARIANNIVESETIYSHWPSVPESEHTLIQILPGNVYEHLNEVKCIPSGLDGRLVKPGEALMLPIGENAVRQALLADDLPLANPVPPKHVVDGFKSTDSPLPVLRPHDVRDELRGEDDPACLLANATRPSLRCEKWVLELLRYCCRDEELIDLRGVPLAITSDGALHAFGLGDHPLLIANPNERFLLGALPELLLAEAVTAVSGFDEEPEACIERVNADKVISLLPRFLHSQKGGDRVMWDPDRDGIPTEPWLRAFYAYLANNAGNCDLSANVLREVPLVPDQFGSLWPMGFASTPLLPSTDRAQARLVDALRPFRVPVIDANPDLLKEIRRLVDACDGQAIWRITGPDLVDTLSAVRDEWDPSTGSYSDDTHGLLLDFLATSEARRGATTRADKLRALPIFPAHDGSLVTLDSGCVFLPAGYSLPPLEAGLGFLSPGPDGAWLPLYEALNVPSLSRERFIRDVLLPRYADVEAEDQIQLLQWLRTHLEEAFNELNENQGRAFHAELRNAELVQCTDGRMHQGQALYHPDAEDVLGDLLGDAAGFPDMTVYSTRKDSWFRLFERLGMTSQPRAIDLLAAIDGAVSTYTDEHATALASLQKIVEYLRSHWADLRDTVVEDDPQRQPYSGGWTLLDALNVRAWLPVLTVPPRGFPDELFAGHSDELARPDSLFSRGQLDLVSLVAPVSRFDLGPLGNDVGICNSADVATTLHQLRAVLATVNGQNPEEELDTRTVRVFHRIYEHLGLLFPPSSDQEVDSFDAMEDIRKEFASLRCIVSEDDRLWRPEHVFAAAVPFFIGRRTQVRARNDLVDRGLSVLGRKLAPCADDFVAFFEGLAEELGESSVEELLRPQLRNAFHYASRVDDPNGMLRRTVVVTDQGLFEPCESVVIDDAEWLSERAKQAGLSVLDRELDMKVAKAFGVTSMSKAVFERPCRATENHDPSFAAQSQSIQGVMQSDAFISGLRRLIKATGLPVRDGDLAWLRVLNIRPVDKLFSELVWLDGQEVIADSEGESDVLFDFDASQIVASIQAKDVLCERIASVIAHELSADGYSLADRSSLVAMLRSEPSRISSLLTRLRVPKLIDEAEELEPEEDTDAGFIDNGKASEDEAEDGAVCATDEVEALIEGEKSLDEPDRRLGVSTGQRRRSVTTGEDKKASGEDHQGPREDEDCDQGDAATVAEEASGDEGSGEEWSEASSDQREGGRGTGPRSSQPLGGRSKSSRSRSSETASHSRRAVTYVSSTGDSSATESQDKVDHRNRVDQSAMEIVMQYERDKGRNPVPQEHFHPGYDIESKDRDGHVQRYIEVKGLSGAWNDFGVGVKPRQIDKCREEPERFWLYVVEFALESERAQVFAIPNPVALIDEYRFDGGWKALSREQSGIGQPERPEVGRRVRLTDAREGTVQNVETRGVLMRLKVRIDDGEIEDVVYTPSRITVLPDIGVD